MYNPPTQLPPGFRFHPTDEELIVHYLRNRTAPISIIAEIDIYKFDPWELPGNFISWFIRYMITKCLMKCLIAEKAVFGDREWYFFSPRERKYPNGVRPNRAAVSGYWKATGTDKFIRSGGDNVGVKKSLVFYKGKPPKGLKTNWIMHEYRVAESLNTNSYRPLSRRLTEHSMRLDDWVLCRIYKKSKHVSPPLIDREQDDSSTDDANFPIQNLPLQQALLELPKTSSVSDALEDFSQLFNGFYNQHDLQRFDKNPLIGHPISSLQQTNHDSNDPNGYFLPQLSQKETSASLNLKRQKHDEMNGKEEINGRLQNLYGQFDSSNYSFPNQAVLRLPPPINSRLGLQ